MGGSEGDGAVPAGAFSEMMSAFQDVEMRLITNDRRTRKQTHGVK
jgi:hypothetical protein